MWFEEMFVYKLKVLLGYQRILNPRSAKTLEREMSQKMNLLSVKSFPLTTFLGSLVTSVGKTYKIKMCHFLSTCKLPCYKFGQSICDKKNDAPYHYTKNGY
jgi:hypothetical protein